MGIAATRRHQVDGRGGHADNPAWLLGAIDLIVIFASFDLARIINRPVSGLSWGSAWSSIQIHYGDTPLAIHLALGIACVVAFHHLGHFTRRRPFWQELGDIVAVVLTMAAAHAALMFVTGTSFPRLWWGGSWTLVLVMLPLARFTVKLLLMRRDAWRRRAVVIGAGPNAINAASALANEPLLGLDVIAFVWPSTNSKQVPSHLEVHGRRLPVLHAPADPELLPTHLGRPHIVVALETEEMAHSSEYLERLSLHCRELEIIWPMRGLPLAGSRVTHFFGHDILSLRIPGTFAPPWPPPLKRAFDVLIAGTLLALTSPLFALVAWQVSRTGRPIVYRHERVGRGGRRFQCLKFRTMVPDADSVLEQHLVAEPKARVEWERNRKLRDDPRITSVGAWLRRTSLDELPQLINVLRGDMSLVGPRPVVQGELTYYGDRLVYYMESTPGLTGLWQVSGRNNLDYQWRVHLDSWYVKNWSFWLDLIILMKTARAVLRANGAY